MRFFKRPLWTCVLASFLSAAVGSFAGPPPAAGRLKLDVRPTVFFVEEAGALLQKCEAVLEYAGPEAPGELRIRGFAAEIR
ncbi:MAG: hypothetical protein PHE62_11635, partial [Acidobacteriota bacterium]|nr:hypothetical protein [Acidobacteriota bacterium]